MIPVWDILAQTTARTWVGIFTLTAVAIALFLWRKKARAFFILPLMFGSGLVASRFRVEDNEVGLTVAGVLFLILCLVWLLVETFWSPYADDLAEMESLSDS